MINKQKENFLKHFKEGSLDECWEWSASRFNAGYGQCGHKLAHRVSYEYFIGQIPSGICVLHKCDNPPCVNPKHLFLGTRKDNTHDMINKGRDTIIGNRNSMFSVHRYGENAPNFGKKHPGINEGKIHTEEMKNKNRIAHLGKIMSEEAKNKNRMAHLGKHYPNRRYRLICKKCEMGFIGKSSNKYFCEVCEKKYEVK
jgi:hypothetical protein